MNNFYALWRSIFIYVFLFFSLTTFAQVGIGTTNPNGNALLELDASATPGGLLLPRVALVATNEVAPLTAHLAGMTVYNTATAGTGINRVTPGYYYNDGGQWVRIIGSTSPNENWQLSGNAGTTAGTDFLGTTDNVALQFKTRGFSRFEITSANNQANGGRLRAFTNGTAAEPIYSWSLDPNTGMYRIADNTLGFSTNGGERVRITENGNVGIASANPSERLDVTGNLRLSGAFMPNNIPGGNDKILLSKGAGTAPAWGPGFLNTNQISNIGKYYVLDFDVEFKSTLTLTVTDPNMTTDTSVAYNFIGPLPNGPNYASEVSIMAESRNGLIVFHIKNTSWYDLLNFDIVYTAFYH